MEAETTEANGEHPVALNFAGRGNGMPEEKGPFVGGHVEDKGLDARAPGGLGKVARELFPFEARGFVRGRE